MPGPELAAREAPANKQTRPLPSLQPRKGRKHKSNGQGNGNCPLVIRAAVRMCKWGLVAGAESKEGSLRK